jgi:hypothetical protein
MTTATSSPMLQEVLNKYKWPEIKGLQKFEGRVRQFLPPAYPVPSGSIMKLLTANGDYVIDVLHKMQRETTLKA